MNADIVVATVTFPVMIKIVVIHKSVMTIAHEKLANVTLFVAVVIHTAEFRHAVDVAQMIIAAIADAVAVFIGMGPVIVAPTHATACILPAQIAFAVIDAIVIIDGMGDTPHQTAHVFLANVAFVIAVFVGMAGAVMGAAAAEFAAGIAGVGTPQTSSLLHNATTIGLSLAASRPYQT